MFLKAVKIALVSGLSITMLACATTSVKSTEYVQIVQDPTPVSEDLLMDLGVTVFDPGIDEISSPTARKRSV